MADTLRFDPDNFMAGTAQFRGEDIDYRQYTVSYVTKPEAPALQIMNIYVREDMADDHSAPILFIHRDGGVGESAPWSFEMEYEELHTTWSFKGHTMVGALNEPAEKESTIARILKEGFVLASPGVRGRDTFVNIADEDTEHKTAAGSMNHVSDTESAKKIYVGRGEMPATILDLKAAVRYLKFNKGLVPGDTDKIISEGASSGGGSSALLGASGNSHLYDKYLEEMGAAPASDDIFCAIVDSPIHDFEHIDAAYEWQFGPEYVTGLFADDPDSAAISRAAREKYIEYVDSLELKDPQTGSQLSIRDGSYQAYMLDRLNDSLNIYLSDCYDRYGCKNDRNAESGCDDNKAAWLAKEQNAGLAEIDTDPGSQAYGRAVINSFSSYINWNSGRWMKYVGCYDGFDNNPSRENEAFGDRTGTPGRFSVCLAEAVESVAGHEAEGRAWKEAAQKNAEAVRLMDPYIFIRGEEPSDIAKVWYVRDGGHHETTGAIFLNLCLLLEQRDDIILNWRFCWQQNHTSISLKEFDETLPFLNKYCR